MPNDTTGAPSPEIYHSEVNKDRTAREDRPNRCYGCNRVEAPAEWEVQAKAAQRAELAERRATEDRSAVDRILALGMRKLSAPPVMAMHTEHSRAVRAAFVEGIGYGSRGFMGEDDPEVKHAWARSHAHRRVQGDPPAASFIGWAAQTDDPAASVISVWKIAAIYLDRVWLTASGRDAIVPIASVRLLTGNRLVREEPF